MALHDLDRDEYCNTALLISFGVLSGKLRFLREN